MLTLSASTTDLVHGMCHVDDMNDMNDEFMDNMNTDSTISECDKPDWCIQNKPKLTRKPNHFVKDLMAGKCKCSNDDSSKFQLISQYQNHSYVDKARIVVNGFIFENDKHIPLEIAALCNTYYFDTECGVFQLAYQIYCIFTKLKYTSSLSNKLLNLVIQKCLATNDDTLVSLYLDKLIQSGYLAVLKNKNKYNKIRQALDSNKINNYYTPNHQVTLYKIPMDKLLYFGTYINRQI